MTEDEHQSGGGLAILCLWLSGCLLLVFSLPTRAAYISEIDLGGSTGQGIELSNVDPAMDTTLLFIHASPTSTYLFGLVLDVLHIPAGTGRAGVAMVTDNVWASDPLLTTSLASLPLESGDVSLPLIDHLLLVVMQGRSDVTRADRPLYDAAADASYDETAVTDWLILTAGDQAATYETNHDIASINAGLGIDLLDRLVDKHAGRVIGRTNAPDQPIDSDTFFMGDPDPTSRQFDVGGGLLYTYTPGMSHLPLHTPEPSTLITLGLSMGLVCRRPRR